jgi:anti-sigma factor RsiW
MPPVEPELACQELVELLTDYLDGSLPAGERARLEAHLAECEACDAYLAQFRLTIRLIRLARERRAP